VSGSNPTYQWQVSTGGGPFTNIAGATSSSLVLTGVTLSMNGNQYRCVVSGSLNSNAATLTVNPLPVVALNLPFDTLYQSSPIQTLSGGTPVGGVYSGTGISGTVFNPGALTLGNFITTYRYTDANGCSASATDIFTIITKANPVNIYPNPSTDGKIIIVISPELLGGNVVVRNEAGQKVAEWIIVGQLTYYQFKWASGVYHISFSKGTTRVSKTFIIAK
jgi:hypothetical protein